MRNPILITFKLTPMNGLSLIIPAGLQFPAFTVTEWCSNMCKKKYYRSWLYTFNHYRCRETVAQEIPQGAQGTGLAAGWSAGCAMGEESYSLLLIWDNTVGKDLPQLDLDVVGSDIDELLLSRARCACYAYSSVKALPRAWLQAGFIQHEDKYCLEPRLRDKASFIQQDIRNQSITGPFHIIFCRNLVFTYYEHTLQLELLRYIHDTLIDGGALVIGGHESLPEGYSGFEPWSLHRAIFRKQ